MVSRRKLREQPSRFTGSFNNAFAAARKQGLKQFQWNGKLYGTQLATQQKAPTQQKAAPANEPTYLDSMRRGSLPQVDVVAKRVSTTPIPAPVQPAQNTPSADSLGWGRFDRFRRKYTLESRMLFYWKTGNYSYGRSFYLLLR